MSYRHVLVLILFGSAVGVNACSEVLWSAWTKNKTPNTYNNWNRNLKPNNQQINCTTNDVKVSVLLIFLILFFFWRPSDIPLSHLSSCVSLCSCFVFSLFLGSIWQRHVFFSLFIISSLFPDDPLFFPSFSLLSVRKGNPAQVFVWWWDRLSCFHSFVILCLFASFGLVLPPDPPPPPLQSSSSFYYFLLFSLGKDAGGVFSDRLFLVRFLSTQLPMHHLLPWRPSKPFHVLTHIHTHTYTLTHTHTCSVLSSSDIWPICLWINSGILVYFWFNPVTSLQWGTY